MPSFNEMLATNPTLAQMFVKPPLKPQETVSQDKPQLKSHSKSKTLGTWRKRDKISKIKNKIRKSTKNPEYDLTIRDTLDLIENFINKAPGSNRDYRFRLNDLNQLRLSLKESLDDSLSNLTPQF